MNIIVHCPYCDTQQFVSLSEHKKYISHKCIEYKCQKIFLVPFKQRSVYLARTFTVSDARYKYPWHVKTFFSGVLNFVDPGDYIDQDLIDHPEKIVSFNESLIDKCDILVAYINQPSFGTLGELQYARHKKMPIYVINCNRVHLNDPWLRYVVDGLYDNIDKCYQHIVNSVVKEYNLKYKGEKNYD